MQLFLKKLAIRLIILCSVIAAWSAWNWSDEYYAELPNGTNYTKYTWIMENLKTERDWTKTEVFMGSSICLNSINDSLLNDLDSTETRYLNLGVPHTCNAIMYELLEEMIEEKGIRPAKVYLCLKSDATPLKIHNLYPMLADAGDMYSSMGDGNVFAIQSLAKRMGWNTHYFTRSVKRRIFFDQFMVKSDFGHRHLTPIDSLSTEREYKKFYAMTKANFEAIDRNNQGVPPNLKLKLLLAKLNWLENAKYQKQAFRNCMTLLNQHQIPFEIIMYPNFILQRINGNATMLAHYDREFPEIQATGHEIITFDGEYLKSANNWIDMNHLNYTGSELLTRRLFEQELK